MKPKTIAATILFVIALLLVAEFAARSQGFFTKQLTVRWKANTEPDMALYRLRFWSTNVTITVGSNSAVWTNPTPTNWAAEVVHPVTNYSFVIPSKGPWVVSLQAVNTAGLGSDWTTGLVFSVPASVLGVGVHDSVLTLP